MPSLLRHLTEWMFASTSLALWIRRPKADTAQAIDMFELSF